MRQSSFRVGNVLALAGGVIALFSFVLPFYSVFGINLSLLVLASSRNTPIQIPHVLYTLPFFTALFLILCACLTMVASRSWNILPFIAGSLGLVLCTFLFLSLAEQADLSDLLTVLSLGFWGNLLGYLLGALGGIIDFL